MPILKKEEEMYPADLLDNDKLMRQDTHSWWCIYTLSRREKDLMRRLRALKIAHYAPIIPKRYRSPNGRLRTSYIPLFPNYVFMFADEEERNRAMTTNCISRCNLIPDSEQLIHELKQIQEIIKIDVPLTPEAKLEAGNYVRVRSGPFAGYEGMVVRREGKTRLLLCIQFLEKGVSMELDEALLEPIN